MALSDDILTILFSYSAGYKRMRQSLLGIQTSSHSRKTHRIKNQTLYLTLARLKKRGLAAKKDNMWAITAKGKKHLKEKSERFLPCHRQPGAPQRRERNMIVAFDIPSNITGNATGCGSSCRFWDSHRSRKACGWVPRRSRKISSRTSTQWRFSNTSSSLRRGREILCRGRVRKLRIHR